MTTIGFIEGRVSSMAKESKQRSAVLQGTLDMMILKTLLYGPAHGHQIGKHIQRATNEFLQMQHGSLYPALHRLEKRGWVVSKWETAPDRNREFKYYRLTDKGKKQLVVEESQWKHRDEDLARELQSDLELEEEEQQEFGLSAEEARFAAVRAFGNPTVIREQTRAVWTWNWLERLLHDL